MRNGLSTAFFMAFGHGLRLDAFAAPGYRGALYLEKRLLICNNWTWYKPKQTTWEGAMHLLGHFIHLNLQHLMDASTAKAFLSD